MANRRIEVHQYREVLYRIRQGETLRAIDRAKLMSRRKSSKLVEIASPELALALLLSFVAGKIKRNHT